MYCQVELLLNFTDIFVRVPSHEESNLDFSEYFAVYKVIQETEQGSILIF